MRDKNPNVNCARILETLDASWVDRPSLSRVELAEEVASHLESCSNCQVAADDLRRMDDCLRNGFRAVSDFVGPPSTEAIEGTIRRVREASPEAELLRKVRRPTRMILWGIFYAFTLIACSLLAVALFKAIKGL